MEINEIRKMSKQDILKKINEDKEELFRKRMAQSSGTLEKPVVLRTLRREIARLKTILKEKLVGKVVSDKNNKTITVLVETYKKHPLYGKRVKYSKNYAAHDEKNEAKVGDTVRISMTRPLSKSKRYELVEVVEKAVIL